VTRSGEIDDMQEGRVWGKGSERMAKKRLESMVRGERAFMALSPSLATSNPEALLGFLLWFFLVKAAT